MPSRKFRTLFTFSLICASCLAGNKSIAVEGGLDVYAPALNSQLGLAEVPGPGNYMLNYWYFLDGDVDAANLGGQRGPRFGEEAFAYVPVYVHVSEHELCGGILFAGIAQPIGSADLLVGGQDFVLSRRLFETGTAS